MGELAASLLVVGTAVLSTFHGLSKTNTNTTSPKPRAARSLPRVPDGRVMDALIGDACALLHTLAEESVAGFPLMTRTWKTASDIS